MLCAWMLCTIVANESRISFVSQQGKEEEDVDERYHKRIYCNDSIEQQKESKELCIAEFASSLWPDGEKTIPACSIIFEPYA